MPTAKKSDELALQEPATLPGELRRVGGSRSDDWNQVLVNQVVSALWSNNFDGENIKKQQYAMAYALIGIAPQSELEGMLAAQLIACHNASMECYRRAMIGEQTLQGRRENLNQANKLSRTYATLLESLNLHRGKGQQKVTVEHVHVHEGGQAIVGNVETLGGGDRSKSEEQAHALGYAPSAAMPSADTAREPVSVTGDAERSMSDARRQITGRAEGQ